MSLTKANKTRVSAGGSQPCCEYDKETGICNFYNRTCDGCYLNTMNNVNKELEEECE